MFVTEIVGKGMNEFEFDLKKCLFKQCLFKTLIL